MKAERFRMIGLKWMNLRNQKRVIHTRPRRENSMKVTLRLLIFPLFCLAACAPSPVPPVGTWHATMNNLPAVTIVIADDDGRLSGNIIFYFQQQDSEGWKVTRENKEPLINLAFSGQTLSFGVSHERAHPGESGPADPPVKFEMVLTGSDEAKLISTNYGVSTETLLKRTN